VTKPPKLISKTVRYFEDDIVELQKLAKMKRSKWQTELRHLVHRALGDLKRLAGGGIIR
jgi:hypothetical protein